MATTFSTGAAPAPARFAVAVMAASRGDGPVVGQLHCFQAVNASAKARSPGVPFSIARMARRLLLYATGMSNQPRSFSN
jgi:hypothetical protein